MKRVRLLLVLGAVFAMVHTRAQSYSEEYQPIVLMMLAEKGGPNAYPVSMERVVVEQYEAVDNAKSLFEVTQRTGFQQSSNPKIIFSTRDNRFALGLGGYVNLRTSYDFMGAVNDIDFVPYKIPIYANYANRQRIMMDANACRGQAYH